jgi:hypothetical protein
MQTIYKDNDSASVIPKLALKPAEACKALGISSKGLWNLSTPRGPLPCLKLGSRVLYPIHLLQEFLSREATRQKEATSNGRVMNEQA